MAEEVRIWRLDGDEKPAELAPSTLDLESRLESWLEHDITMLDRSLLVIGRQVKTDFGGAIDLLCVHESGDLVVVELKRDCTPRDITAQALDYASWVSSLSHEQVIEIAEQTLGRGKFEEAFERRFRAEVPEVLNQDHRLLIVGSRIDPSSERIVRYLSDTHGISINAATFNYFRQPDGSELIARLFLIEPAQVDRQTHMKSGRRRNLSYEELADLAEGAGVGEQYQLAVSGLERILGKRTTRTSIGFTADLDSSRKTVMSLIPGESNPTDGLRFQVYMSRLQAAFDLSEDAALALLPSSKKPWIYYGSADPEYEGYQGFFAHAAEVERLIDGLTSRRRQAA
jgi:hypothetical protein